MGRQAGYDLGMEALSQSIAIRAATPDDDAALWRLAHRDSRPLPAGPLLIAIVGQEIVAAVSQETGEAIAEPFRPTRHIVMALRDLASVQRPRRAA
jgi:hypothetical protein